MDTEQNNFLKTITLIECRKKTELLREWCSRNAFYTYIFTVLEKLSK